MENNNNNSHSNDANNSNPELDRFRQIINNKINEKKNQIFPLHSMAYNNNVQHEINCLKWVLGQTTNTTTTATTIKNQRQIQKTK